MSQGLYAGKEGLTYRFNFGPDLTVNKEMFFKVHTNATLGTARASTDNINSFNYTIENIFELY
jgi:hypothetical protein